MALLLGLAVFIVWDSRRLRRAAPATLTRERMKRSVTPGDGTKWQIQAALAVAALGLAVIEWLSPSAPPFTGRGSLFFTWAHEVLGPKGKVAALAIVGAGLLVPAWFELRRTRRDRRESQ